MLQRLEDARLTFSREKSAFGQSEIMVVGHLCGPYGRKPSPAKVEAISAMKHDCNSVTEVRRFLGAYTFYHIWIPHYVVALLRACVDNEVGPPGSWTEK